MATRHTSGKSTQRTTSSAARKPAAAGAPSLAKSGRGSASQPGKAARNTAAPAGRPAKGSRASASQAGRGAAAASAAVSQARGGIGGAWQTTLRRAGGGVSFTTLIVSLLGLGVSSYLTIEHFAQSPSFACPENATINCVKVTTSPESHVFGIPVAVLGLAFYLFMVAANSPWGWRAPWPAVHWARLGSVAVGIVFVLYLIWAELFRINAICLYCTAVHVLTFILFGLIVGRAAFSGVRAIPDRG